MSGPSKEQGSKPAHIQKREDAARTERDRKQHEENIAAINSLADELAADQQKNDTNESKRALREKVTIALLVGTVIAAGIGDWIFYKTLRNTDVNFRADERPYVWLVPNTDKFLLLKTADGTKGVPVFDWQIQNFGKGLARDVKIVQSLNVTGNWPQSTVRNLQGLPIQMTPGYPILNTASNPAILTEADFDGLGRVSGGLTFRATITYADVYGTTYESDICIEQWGGGAHHFCNGTTLK